MNTLIEHKGIKLDLQLNEPPFEIKDRGWHHIAKVVSNTDRDQLKDLLGLTLWGEPIIGVESFAVSNQEGRPVGLLLRNKKW